MLFYEFLVTVCCSAFVYIYSETHDKMYNFLFITSFTAKYGDETITAIRDLNNN